MHTLKKIVWKTPRRLRTGLSPTPSPSAAPKSHLLQEPDVLLHRVAVKLWSQGAVFHAVPGNGKVVQRQVADKSLSRKTAYIMYVYIYITYSDIVDNAMAICTCTHRKEIGINSEYLVKFLMKFNVNDINCFTLAPQVSAKVMMVIMIE